MAPSPTKTALVDLRDQERRFLRFSALDERPTLLRVVAATFAVLGAIAAGFLWDTAPQYALAAAVPVTACLAWDAGLGRVMRRLRAGVPELRVPHLDVVPLIPPGDELPLYPLLLAGGCLAGLAVAFVLLLT